MTTHVIIEALTTSHYENLTLEFRPTAQQKKRLSEVWRNWKHDTVNVEIEDGDKVGNLIVSLIERMNYPTNDDQGESIFYGLAKLAPDDTSSPKKTSNPFHKIIKRYFHKNKERKLSEKITPLYLDKIRGVELPFILAALWVEQGRPDNEYDLLNQMKIEEGDRLVLFPRLRGGGPDPLTIVAGLAAITQVMLMIIDMWMRNRKAQVGETSKEQNSKHDKPWDEIKEIRIEMSDGNWIKFNDSRHDDLSKVRNFVEVLNLPSESPKPVKVVLILKNGSKAIVNVTNSQESKQQLDEFLKILNL